MAETLAALRSLMASHSPPLHDLLVPSEDYHQSEYVSAQDERREFVSVFTGSAGLALITRDEARLWTDGRYFLQANAYRRRSYLDTAQRWELAFGKKQQKLVQTLTNLVDEVWKNRPPTENNPVVVHPLEFAGRSVAEKLKDLREKLANEKSCGIVITALDEVSWLYNIRGSDVSYCPFVHAFAIVTLNSAFFYADKRKQKKPVMILYGLTLLRAAMLCFQNYVNKVLLQRSPLGPAKALKNPVELDRLRNAHNRDGAAVVQYLVWLDKQLEIMLMLFRMLKCKRFMGLLVTSWRGRKTMKLTEVTASDMLEGFRASKEHFRGLSFPTISSVGPNAAIIHYAPQAETCAELDPNSIYLFDSGAQVLKSYIALGNARFPNGTNGQALDVLARIPLWRYGLDYRHGTGYGIGSDLNVHEGPHQISFRPHARNVPLQASMTVTDEPGYKMGASG
ncbi:hypothetical protein PTKIN_Ptkin08bG0181000 [Pterospermum kingtungense]